jgi:hypothetical protein
MKCEECIYRDLCKETECPLGDLGDMKEEYEESETMKRIKRMLLPRPPE